MCEAITEKIILGQYNCLKVLRESDFGLYLQAGDGSELLMPKSYVDKSMTVDSLVNAFVYTDSEDRMVATLETPKALMGQFAFLECVDVTSFGAFMDWGILKDLLVPRSAQKVPMVKGEKYLVRISFDNNTHRLVGVAKSKPFIKKADKTITKFGKYKAIVEEKTPLGYKVIVANQFSGMLFKNEIFEKLSIGDEREVYIKNVREDGKLDCSLQAIGDSSHDDADEKVMKLLREKKQLPYNSKSDPTQIKNVFGLSKKAFKATLQRLQNDGKLEIKETGIYLK